MYGPYHIRTQSFLLSTHELFEEIYCYVIIAGDVDSNIRRKKIVDLPLAIVLGLKLF